MNQDTFNIEIRKFLKLVGVTSQREIEKAVEEALAAGQLKGGETLSARMVLTIEGLGVVHEIKGGIALE
ncbi:hypothetical protein J2847_001503 [Azospirillum agricola]|uniref:DUF6494 family protein n=1 Tax=Azospirillum agricola TaxID=1720247 RepID=UPI001AE101BD|nr:DUF6494 family protein [Azospirillum agricola]MBP2228221.1 hypothetical protein [Azospirillum agricola]